MADLFTIKRVYDRDKIMEDAKKVLDMGGDILNVRAFLNTMYEGWSFDIRTSVMVELFCRDSDDVLYPVFQDRLDKLNRHSGDGR